MLVNVTGVPVIVITLVDSAPSKALQSADETAAGVGADVNPMVRDKGF